MNKPRPWWKKLLFGLIATVLFFAVLEVSLALFGVSSRVVPRDPFVTFAPGIPLFEEQAGDDGRILLTTHPDKLTWFNRQSFPRTKPPNSHRIFCVGGSTTYGRPYDDSTSFPGWLRELLPVADGSRSWEVINAGGISYAGYRVARVMEELTRYQPDLFIVYCGHNEFLEERTYRDIKRLPEALLQTQALLSRTRTYATLQRIVSPKGDRSTALRKISGEVVALLDHTIGPELYQRDDNLRRQILDHYAFNLSRMVSIARSAGAVVLFVTPASNLKDASPFKSVHDQTLSLEEFRRRQRLFDEAIEFENAGKAEEALAAYEKAAEIDARFAELHYRMGKLLLAMNRFHEAKTAFQRARDEDVCPLRALTEMSEYFQQFNERDGVLVVDFEALVEEECLRKLGHRIPGKEFFFDHVHPRIPMNRLLAEAVINRLIEREIVIPDSSWNEQHINVVADRIESRITPEAQAVALRNQAKVLTWAGKHDESGPLALEALQTLPDDYECLFMAGTFLRRRGKPHESFDCFSKAIGQSDDAPDLHLGLAKIAVSERKFEQARLHYEEVLRLRPEDEEARQGLLSIQNR